ncbi:MAG: acyl-CoA dehydrogenase family protein [Proteobacteria bacterium]|nr:acyl-CoA dehydrogenase family protein [Pseudomonadota bacterium]
MSSYLGGGVLLYVRELVDWDRYFRLRKGEDVDVEAEKAALVGVLETAAGICAEIEVDARRGWEQAARLEDGRVLYPDHIQAGYDKLREAGLVSLGVEEQYGGFGLPALVTNLVIQMVARADASLMTIVGLQTGVAEDIQQYASEELKQQYLPRFASGEVMGAMDLTESQAGSDLGGITTRATEEGGRFFLEGEKIFITNGGCEVHLVLARDDDTFDASKGTTNGLSLYLCPRTLPDGTPNGVCVARLEHKLGIHGSPTATVTFERAEAWAVGKKGDGFKAMLSLMNNARLGVAAQGIGISEAALAAALRYARERVQFGKPIGDQPLMKNLLARMVLALEGSRALLYRACVLVDRNRAIRVHLASHPDLNAAERADLDDLYHKNETRYRLLTPLAKYLATEHSDFITRAAIQVHGGLGFMAESEVGKLHQDSIITTIYEGTSEIQVSFALKEIGKGALQVVFEEIGKELEGLSDPPLQEYADKVRHGIERILDASSALMADFDYALLSARSLADIVIDVIVGAELLKQANVDSRRFDLAASWINRRMLDVEATAQRIKEGTTARIDRAERILALVD